MNGIGIALLFLSDYKADKDIVNEYKAGVNRTVQGKQTNEAPMCWLLQKAKDEQFPVQRILCIVSEKVKNQYADNRPWTEEFRERIGASDIDFVEISYLEDVKASGDVYKEINKSIEEMKKRSGDAEIQVYVDYTGGLRDASFLMTSIVQYLEFVGIRCSTVVYGNFFKAEIADITNIYDINRLISAVNLFVTSGNATLIDRFYKEHNIKDLKLFDAIREFADSILLCNVNEIDHNIIDISNEISSFEKSAVSSDLYYEMIKTILPIIREKLYLDKVITKEGIYYPWIIKWCLDNGMVQQAVTIFVEKMPEFYINQDLFRDFDPKNFYEYYNRFVTIQSLTKDTWTERVLDEVQDYYSKNGNLKGFQKYIVSTTLYTQYSNETEKQEILGRIMRIWQNSQTITIETGSADLWDFIQKATNSSRNKYIMYFLRGEFSGSSGYNLTYEKKYQIIKDCSASTVDRKYVSNKVSPDSLSKILRYYLAVKIIRNKLNHATDTSTSDASEITVIQRLKDDYGIEIVVDKDKICKILNEGIEDYI